MGIAASVAAVRSNILSIQRRRYIMKLVCFGLLLVLCQPIEEQAQVTLAVCPVIATWTADYQKRLASELRALPVGSAIEHAVAEALSLRDQARACASSR
jgi:hypothetical protein